jgi:YD repeat-containing protein
LNTLTYPSGHTINNLYDQAGRLTGFSGNLGDGNTRTYSSGMLYSPVGGLVKEQFGTATPIYNKLFYNSRGQLAEIRESTSYTGPSDFSSDRGAIVNNYSNNCTGICSGSSMPDNNGNLRKQEIHIPSQTMRYQEYDYDSLNRLNSAREVLNGGAEQWKQAFTYDRWGNRTINTAVTYGIGINNKAFNVNTVNNRLEVPGGQSGVMQYDAAGNLTNDTYTGAGNRTYDGENKITSAWGGNNQAQLYAYDASGQRIKRTVDGVETWQVYGIGGELLAEYPANGPTTSPQKEYGYRNGQLLITAPPVIGGDHSLSLNGTTAYVQVPNSSSLNITGAITVEAWIKVNAIGNYQDSAEQ